MRQTQPMRGGIDRRGTGLTMGTLLLVSTLIAAAGGLGVWAGRTLLAPPSPLPAGREYSVVTAQEGELERSLSLNVAARWSGGARLDNEVSGRITQLRAKAGRPVSSGDVVYTVDLKPVVVAAGAVPVFRDLSSGIRGADVRQLQEMLRAGGYRSSGADGVFGAGTAEQVRAWQRDLGAEVAGRVETGRVVFVPSLPGVLAWTEDGVVGARVAPGPEAARILPDAPAFTMTVPANQLTLVRTGMAVEIDSGAGPAWRARVGQVGQPDDDGSAVATLEPVSGQAVCGTSCAVVPVSGSGALSATVTVVPRQSGAVLPTAALAVGVDGRVAVVREDGSRVPVTVRASTGGQVLVSGISVGDRVRVSAPVVS